MTLHTLNRRRFRRSRYWVRLARGLDLFVPRHQWTYWRTYWVAP